MKVNLITDYNIYTNAVYQSCDIPVMPLLNKETMFPEAPGPAISPFFTKRNSDLSRDGRKYVVDVLMPHQTFASFQRSLRAPLAIPFAHLSMAINFLGMAVRSLAVGTLQLCTLNLKMSLENIGKAVANVITAITTAIVGLINILKATILLATKLLPTIGYGVYRGLVATKNCIFSPKREQQFEEIALARDENNMYDDQDTPDCSAAEPRFSRARSASCR